MKKLFFIIFCFLVGVCSAQFLDSLHHAFKGKKSFDFGYGSRYSFINNNLVTVYSLKVGIEFDEKISIGGGYAWLQTPLFDTHTFYDGDLKKDTTVKRQLTFNYICFYFNFVYYKSKRWELSIPLQAGVGKLGFNYQYKGINKNDDAGYCFLYEPEVNVKYKIFRWLGAETDIGYRLLINNNHFIQNAFNSPLFSIGVFIIWDEVALMAFPKNKWIQKKLGPSEW